MESVWRESFEIKSYNVDFQQNVKPSVLMQFFQEVASNHAASLGAGYDALILRELFWALSRLTVEITRIPKWGETILIETWPVEVKDSFSDATLLFTTTIKKSLSGRYRGGYCLPFQRSGHNGRMSLDLNFRLIREENLCHISLNGLLLKPNVWHLIKGWPITKLTKICMLITHVTLIGLQIAFN